MTMSCVQQAERVEESVLQPVDQWIDQQQQRCRDEPCNWWTLCLNKLFCWIVVVLVKVVVWVVTTVVRWVYRTVCTLVSVVVGVVLLIVGKGVGVLVQALKDAWTLIKDGIYTAVGAVIFAALRIVDVVQGALGLQPAKRRLTERERAILAPIYREALAYDAIELVVGRAGLLGVSGRAFTMGYTIYLPDYDTQTLVHESVHTWQFQTGGFRYIGNSALNQLDGSVFSRGYDPYAWRSRIDAGDSWFTLGSAEAQASFVEDVWAVGRFDFADLERPDAVGQGAFFREDETGTNVFTFGGTDYTKQANAAWHILRTR